MAANQSFDALGSKKSTGTFSFYGLAYQDLVELCRAQGLAESSPTLLYNWHYKKNRREPCAHHNLAKRTRDFLLQRMDFALPEIHTVHVSKDTTVKFLFRLKDGRKVESVLIPFQGKYTVCLSSQVGCGMNCSFCFTGLQGLTRHLDAEEIVGQFLGVQTWLTQNRPGDDRILNIVYMGQGEPLHNFDAVKKSAQIFIAQQGLSIADHKITISTSGYLPGLERWKSEMPDVNIALSLHAVSDDKRSQLIPINRKFPLSKVLPAVDAIPTGKKRFVTYEYLLLQDFNDSFADAHALGHLLERKKAFINLIPFNPYPGSRYQRPAPERVDAFKAILDQYRVPTSIRTTKGDEILAACGQLNTKTANAI